MDAVLLLSGGIDSPVAAKMVQRQGSRLEALHCSFEPITGPESVEKAKEWYQSADYQAVVGKRLEATDGFAIISKDMNFGG